MVDTVLMQPLEHDSQLSGVVEGQKAAKRKGGGEKREKGEQEGEGEEEERGPM